MVSELDKFSKMTEHQKCDSAVVVVLSHGLKGEVYGSDGKTLSIEKIVSYLDVSNCPGLKEKPKIFIFQACRGDAYDGGIIRMRNSELGVDIGERQHALEMLRNELESRDEADARSIANIPTGSDIIIGYATTPGYVSWRSTVRGSWFVQAICQVFAKWSYKEDVLSLFTEVNRLVSEKFTHEGHKQQSEVVSRLRRKLFLLPGQYTVKPQTFIARLAKELKLTTDQQTEGKSESDSEWTSHFAKVELAPPIEGNSMFLNDGHPDKVNLSTGDYYTDDGKPWILPVVHEVEKRLVDDASQNHEYLPVLGFEPFSKAASEFLLGSTHPAIADGRNNHLLKMKRKRGNKLEKARITTITTIPTTTTKNSKSTTSSWQKSKVKTLRF